mmetsp:Transcript_25878/g.26092  ORF Transcript_25878/g.26092 Transcript_25878/m.26092 type:complete len:572 (-) Transcript_25878:131-1846(-)|eukprot:CAMPEP_0182429136 /NCGR_PEP_ID=MMETSP1167-20130531/25539_1 /TAXON_ID=2988 /ORGANISM="Mallomonas Sp, Strain CCMP3275" /LENGTH=571 /DNA_ID=CAMNT_0024612483 /DNA_START=157 /DNA_END=1872 /DNA_ORIENTATION=+
MMNGALSSMITLCMIVLVVNTKSIVAKTRAELQDDLLFAAEMGHDDDVAKFIAEKKIDLEMAWQENTPLLMAATHNRTKTVELLLEAGVDPNVMARDGTRPITTSSYHGHVEVVKLLIKYGADLKKNDNVAGVSNAMIVAASNNQVAIIKLLLKHGMPIDMTSESGDTALILASLNGHYEAAELLIKKGSNIEHKNHQGNTAILAAAFKGKCKVVDLLLRKGADGSIRNYDTQFPMVSAATNGYSQCIRSLAKFGADVSATDRLNNSALTMASRSNHVDAVRVLIEYGVNLEQADDLRMTAIHHALSHNHLKTVKILALAGASFGPAHHHDGVNENNIAKVETCDWFRSILIRHKLPTKQQKGNKNKPPMKACEWIRHLGFDGSIVPILDQIQLYGYAAMVRLLKFELFSRGEQDAYNLDALVRKAYVDLKDLHSKEYRVAYRFTDETVIEDELPGLLKHKFGMKIDLPEEKEAAEAEKRRREEQEQEELEAIRPQIHRPKPEERPEFAKNKPGEEGIESELERYKIEYAKLAALNASRHANDTVEEEAPMEQMIETAQVEDPEEGLHAEL